MCPLKFSVLNEQQPQSVGTELPMLVCPSLQPGLLLCHSVYPARSFLMRLPSVEVTGMRLRRSPAPNCSLKKWRVELMARPGSNYPLLFFIIFLSLCLPQLGYELELSSPAGGSAWHREEIEQRLQKAPAGINAPHQL